jgi:Flp pilus assembly protein TadD
VYCSRRSAPGLTFFALTSVALASFTLTSCARKTAAEGTERIAVLRFENLSSDASASWVGRAFSEIIGDELAGVASLRVISSSRLHSYDRAFGVHPVAAPGISAESSQAVLAGATRIVYGDYTLRNGRLEAQVTVEDPRTMRMTQSFMVSAPPANILQAASEIARRISPGARPYGTQNTEALAAYIQGLESGDVARMEMGFTAAIKADPDFGPPYRALANERSQRGDRAGAIGATEQALARGDRIAGLERARLELQAAELSGDLSARYSALEKLVKLDPSDAAVWNTLGQIELNRHEYKRATANFQKAAALEPGDAAVWNLLGYASAYAGELETGMSALRRYQALSPAEANPLDSMGDINFASGRLAEAEKFYLEAHRKDPNFLNQGDLLKAAIARIYTGDIAGATQLSGQYFDARRQMKDPIVDYQVAQWSWLTGHRREAVQQMQAFVRTAEAENSPLHDVGSRAESEMAVWKLMLGDRAEAAQLAAHAATAASPSARGNAIVAAFLAMPPATSSEWTVRAEQQFGGPGQTQIRNFALAYALLLNREFAAAQLLFRQMWESGSPIADEGMPVMLAWSYLETGKVKEAAPLLRFNPIPNANGLTPYASFYLPRLFYLRGLLTAKEGRDPHPEYKKFLDLSGAVPLIWNEERKAQ